MCRPDVQNCHQIQSHSSRSLIRSSTYANHTLSQFTLLSPDCYFPLQGPLLIHLQRSQSLALHQVQTQPTTLQTHQTFLHGSQSACASVNVLPQLRLLPHPNQPLNPTHQRLHSSISISRRPPPLPLQPSTSPAAASQSLCYTGCVQPSGAMKIQPWCACPPLKDHQRC